MKGTPRQREVKKMLFGDLQPTEYIRSLVESYCKAEKIDNTKLLEIIKQAAREKVAHEKWMETRR